MFTFQNFYSESKKSNVAYFPLNDGFMKEERLPFTIRVTKDPSALEKAIAIRHNAYMRHLPEFASSLALPEEIDTENGVVVFLAESKLDGSPIGTLRGQSNDYHTLSVEDSFALPLLLSSRRIAEATRLGVTQDRLGRLVTVALFKAFFLYCMQNRIECMVVTARAPMDQYYERLMFDDVVPGAGFIPLKHVGNIPHRIMSLDILQAKEEWVTSSHPNCDFFFNTFHEDINVSELNLRQVPSAIKGINS